MKTTRTCLKITLRVIHLPAELRMIDRSKNPKKKRRSGRKPPVNWRGKLPKASSRKLPATTLTPLC